MKFYFVTTRKGLCVFILFLIMVLGVLVKVRSVLPTIDGSTHFKRIEYLKSLRLSVDENDFSSKEITIPSDFDGIYKKYNAVQNAAGFDLARYKGRKATFFAYKLDENRSVSLLVCNGEIIGGDICNTKADGEIYPLLRQ